MLKKLITYTLAFFIAVQVGEITVEYSKVYFAELFGYDAYYEKAFGRLFFYNAETQNEIKEIYNSKNLNFDNKFSDNEFKTITDKNTFYLAIIEYFGIFLTLIITITGIRWRYFRIKKNKDFTKIDIMPLMLSFFFLREPIIVLWHHINKILLCNDKMKWEIIGLNPYIYFYLFYLLSVILIVYILFKLVPKNDRIIFIISGLIGSIIGIYLYAFHDVFLIFFIIIIVFRYSHQFLIKILQYEIMEFFVSIINSELLLNLCMILSKFPPIFFNKLLFGILPSFKSNTFGGIPFKI